ncbi:MAG: biopolymer transporter ExbD [Runella slithyformis]|jgi:biopolymer transport protein ExbD|nr:MAG: biopolymer transporter ExbD [Runella slithyformis]TAF94801.1 MAG: biopolymer transporter ExbD [Runella sp.]TAG17613.1 MAG: biopolymer transporter ExbD [Cytophagales bacterium]TAG36593.1 MAG: biopolymer transporter ExbD [Cytophagia bacterium]TAF29429.1 MAG: biopolymer transporter ExbD [Runella slithyformis]
MSEIQQGGGGGHKKGGKVRSKKASTRVDMTPMVDLGFLLITFFILATTLSKPSAMQLNVPDKQKDEVKTDPIKASKVLTLYLGKNNVVHALDGVAPDDEEAKTKMKDVSFGPDLRAMITASRTRINAANPEDKEGAFVCVIKPLKNSTYKNMVDALDEMTITKTKRYALVDLLLQTDKDLLGDKLND